MTENKLRIIKKALIDIEQREARIYDSLPKVNFVHSEEYERKIAKLLSEEKKHVRYTPRKIAAVLIAATLIFALSVTAFAFRESIKQFFVDIYETFVEITANEPEDEPLPTKIEQVYTIVNIPEEFEKIEDTADEVIAQQCWMCDTGMIVLQQILAQDTEISSSNENAVMEEAKLGDKTLFWINENGIFTVYWTEKGYIFTLSTYGEFSLDDIQNMILSIAPKK